MNSSSCLSNADRLKTGMAHVEIISNLNKSNVPGATSINKEMLSDSRSRLSGGQQHRKALDSIDSKVNGAVIGNTKKNTGDRKSLFIRDIGIIDKNLADGKKGSGYINVKTLREKGQKTKIKQQLLGTNTNNRAQPNHKNLDLTGKENLYTSNSEINRINSMINMKSASVNIVEDFMNNSRSFKKTSITKQTQQIMTSTIAITHSNRKAHEDSTKSTSQNPIKNSKYSNRKIHHSTNKIPISTEKLLTEEDYETSNIKKKKSICIYNIETQENETSFETKQEMITITSEHEEHQLVCDDENIVDLKLKNKKKSFVDSNNILIANDPNNISGEIEESTKNGDLDGSYCDGSTADADEFDVLPNFMADEERYRVDQKVIEQNQKEIKWKMRAILYDWMAEVCNDYMFKRETYHSSTKLVDLFMMKVPFIKKNEFQLVGLCAIFIAMKMEEIVTICSDD